MLLRLGSRGSPLALWQARYVEERLREAWPDLEVEVAVIKTEGDRDADASLTASGGSGMFVREIESALVHGSIDVAVHSLKDLPTETPAGLVLAAIPSRHDPRDALCASAAGRVEDLPPGALVATGSPRRRCQLLRARPDLRFTPVRGNIDTRLGKLALGQFDALILAVAGIERLGLTRTPYAPIPLSLCLPAPGQGALAIEIRLDDAKTRRLVQALDDPDSACCVVAERSFLAALGAGCLAPAAALATVAGATLSLEAMVGSPDGRVQKRERLSGPRHDAEALGAEMARRLLEAGGEEIVRGVREAEARREA